jgi:hypothetical protein
MKTVALTLVIVACAIFSFAYVTACSNETDYVRSENIPPPGIISTALVVQLKTVSPYCDMFYWIDTKAHICMGMACSGVGTVMTDAQCDKLFNTYVKAER